ncbi:DUF3369 domain-containing protein [Shewanella gelidii]|uniref:DUF3369 domain-containing protein n=1 Tax=Shewanella gelidii TaxID=1642821 RepID=A0A917NDN1_9GAMM|nr:DUF3369 domain-containing protein [Shewanella gelidii]MCL1098093.1 DUF3369 domain-containing protein [Shewanella gelidii]GGI90367.1 hypothetical protein GCM10009332_29690 [Shewanella gelidii]
MLIDMAKKSPLFSGNKSKAIETEPAWKVLIVDDEPDVHTVTKLALSRFKLDNRSLEFINAYSGEQAREILEKESDIAVAFVDVVMESDHAGLELIKWIREENHNHVIRLILRTGQPGQAPEENVIVNYDINDYKSKAELDSRKLVTSVYSALRSYRDIMEIEKSRQIQVKHRHGLERVLKATSGLFELRNLQQFADGLLAQVASLLNIDQETMLVSYNALDVMSERIDSDSIQVLAATGKFGHHVNQTIPEDIIALLQQAIHAQQCLYQEDVFVGYFPTNSSWVNLLYIDGVKDISPLDKQLIDIFSINVGVAFENLLLNQEIEDTQSELILKLGDVVESRSKETAHHVRRMAEYCHQLGILSGLPIEEAELLKRAAPMHDIGKIATPDAILLKPGKLDSEEWEVMRQHPNAGYQILADTGRPLLDASAIIALQHHEKFDGSGYPNGIQGEEIHVFARIVAIADVFDALSHKRCYKEAWPIDKVIEEMDACSGSHFDPRLIKIFLENIEVFLQIKQSWLDPS